MAELALGGMELALRPRTRSGRCAHDTTLSVTASGVRRSICEACGHISVRFVSEASGPAYRSRFSRPADEGYESSQDNRLIESDSPQANPFVEEARLGVRRREPANQEKLLLSA